MRKKGGLYLACFLKIAPKRQKADFLSVGRTRRRHDASVNAEQRDLLLVTELDGILSNFVTFGLANWRAARESGRGAWVEGREARTPHAARVVTAIQRAS